MHDPTITSTLLYRQLFLSESALNKFRHYGHTENDHLYQIHSPDYKNRPPSVSNFISSSRQNEILNIRNQICLVPLLHRLIDADTASDIPHQSEYMSVTSKVAAERRYSDFLREREQYELVNKYKSADNRSLSSDTFYQAFTGSDNIPHGKSAAVWSNNNAASTNSLRGKQQSLLSFSEPPRATDTLSSVPLRVSTSLPSSVLLSPHPSPCSHHRSPVSPVSPWATSYQQQKMVADSNLISPISLPSDVSFLEEFAFGRDRTLLLPGALLSTTATSPPFWNPSLSALPHSSSFSPLKQASASYTPYARPASHQGVSLPFTAVQRHHHHLNQHRFATDSMYSNNSFGVDFRPSPGKELLTKSLKHSHARHRHDLSGALITEREHRQQLGCLNKSPIAQTQYSRTSSEILPPTAPPPFAMIDNVIHGQIQSNSTSGHPYPQNIHSLPPPPPLLRYFDHPPSVSATPIQETSPKTQIIKTTHHNLHSLPLFSTPPPSASLPPSNPPSTQNTPLNLSITNASLKFSITPPTSSPHIGQLPVTDYAYKSHESNNPILPSNTRLSRHVTAAQDESIEEHFRRSLGKSYAQPSSFKTVTVHFQDKIDSVDDHFARALGDQMWTKIKDRSEHTPHESLTCAVDSHFSKALGESTWKKLKSEHKHGDTTSHVQNSQFKQQQNRHQDNHMQSSSTFAIQTSLIS